MSHRFFKNSGWINVLSSRLPLMEEVTVFDLRFMRNPITILLIFIGLFLLGFGIWKTQFDQPEKLVAFERFPTGIMGTSCHLVVVMDFREKEAAKKILDKAEYRIRHIESLASNWIEDSEISVFNKAEAGFKIDFSKANAEVIQAGYDFFRLSHGHFDMTCQPLIRLWKEAGKEGVLPSVESIHAAKAQSSWNDLKFHDNGVVEKLSDTVELALGGIAKGYAIDRALEAMSELGAVGGMVDIGGDLRVFGSSSNNEGAWLINIKHPFEEGILSQIRLHEDSAICTSGNYARYVVIDGIRYSHIVDPSSGYPTKQVPSVTVIAPTTMEADVWATALSVSGPRGLEFLPEDVQCMLLFGDNDASEVFETENFPVHVKESILK